MVNRAAFSGAWYAADPSRLASDLVRYIETVPRDVRAPPGVRGAVMPHAGLSFSGRGMAHAFARLQRARPVSPVRTLIIAPSHYESIPADTLLFERFGSHETPLGPVEGDAAFADAALIAAASLPGGPVRTRVSEATIAREHAVELFLPFIRHTLPGTRVNAVLTGPLTSSDAARAAGEAIATALGNDLDGTLIIASSDFTHYGDRFAYVPFGTSGPVQERVRERDLFFARTAAEGTVDDFFDAVVAQQPTICGRYAILELMAIEAVRASIGHVVDYYNSNEVTASEDTDFVCYAAVLYG